MSFNTPILFLIFNRPKSTQLVFDVIVKIKPSKLYIAADGPRDFKENEKSLCDEVRKIVTEGITWDCEVKFLFRNENLGCGKAVSEAINWFFFDVEEGIILEDDTIPTITFFSYCQEMLNIYRNDERIWSISGFNFGASGISKSHNYTFAKFMNMWGWATWKRTSLKVDYSLFKWREAKNKKLFTSLIVQDSLIDTDLTWIDYWTTNFYLIVNGKIDTWDYQWIYSQLINKGLTIYPSVNLVENIGFNEFATHTTNKVHKVSQIKTGEIELNFSKQIPKQNKEFQNFYLKKIWASIVNDKFSLKQKVKFKSHQLKYYLQFGLKNK